MINVRKENETTGQTKTISSNLKCNVGLTSNFCIRNDSNSANMSLQEAFETFRCDLISRSRLRQREIKFRAQQRQQDAEYRRQHMEHLAKCESREKKKSILKKTTSIKKDHIKYRKYILQYRKYI